MAFNKWLECVLGCLSIFATLSLIRLYLDNPRQQEPKPSLDIESRSRTRTQQDILNEYKQNPGHKFLTRSEQRFRERQLKKHLKRTWRTEPALRREPPVNVDPAISSKEISRMNRQLRQQSQSQPSLQISHHTSSSSSSSSHLHFLFNRLCIHTALIFLSFTIFCHSLRINLKESYLLQVEQESDQAEFWELDPV